MLINIFKLIILTIMLFAVHFALRDSWSKCYGWLGIDMALIIVGVFCFGM